MRRTVASGVFDAMGGWGRWGTRLSLPWSQSFPGEPSCPNCGVGATARAKACAHCGYRFHEDSLPGPLICGAMRANRQWVRAVVSAAGAVAVVGAAASLVARDPEEADADVDAVSSSH